MTSYAWGVQDCTEERGTDGRKSEKEKADPSAFGVRDDNGRLRPTGDR